MMKKTYIAKTLISSAVMMAFHAGAATSYMEARSDAMGAPAWPLHTTALLPYPTRHS